MNLTKIKKALKKIDLKEKNILHVEVTIVKKDIWSYSKYKSYLKDSTLLDGTVVCANLSVFTDKHGEVGKTIKIKE